MLAAQDMNVLKVEVLQPNAHKDARDGRQTGPRRKRNGDLAEKYTPKYDKAVEC